MKRILFVSDVTLSNPSSGSEQVLFNQAHALQQLGHRCSAITRSNAYEKGYQKITLGIHEVCYYANPAQPLHFAYKVLKRPGPIFARLSAGGEFDIVLCHQPFTSFSLLTNGRLAAIPILYVLHSPNHEEYLISRGKKASFLQNLQARTRRAIEGFCLRKSKKIMVLSNYMKQRVISHHGIPGEKIVVNPGAVDTTLFAPVNDRLLAKKRVGFKNKRLHVLTVRNLEIRMGLANLIEAFEILRNKGTNCQLIIGGSGPEKSRLEEMVTRRYLEDTISFAGFIPAEELPVYYSAADFFVIPTRALEGFGLVTPESMACGTPVLGTPVGGTQEILNGFNNAFLFKDRSPMAIAEGLQAVYAEYFFDKEKYNALRQRCRRHVKNRYTWNHHVKKLVELINSLTLNKTCEFKF